MLRSRDVLLKFGCRHSNDTHTHTHTPALPCQCSEAPQRTKAARTISSHSVLLPHPTNYIACTSVCVRSRLYIQPHAAQRAPPRVAWISKLVKSRDVTQQCEQADTICTHRPAPRIKTYSAMPHDTIQSCSGRQHSAPEGNITVVQLNKISAAVRRN